MLVSAAVRGTIFLLDPEAQPCMGKGRHLPIQGCASGDLLWRRVVLLCPGKMACQGSWQLVFAQVVGCNERRVACCQESVMFCLSDFSPDVHKEQQYVF